MSARNILFLYNKVNSLLSPWHTNQSHCFMASSFQAKTLAATRSIYVPLTCPNSASFSLMSLLPRRDSCAVWAIKQRELSHFLFITTDCYLSSQPTLSPSIHPGWKPPHFSVLPLQWLCFTDFLLGWWAQKHILQTNKYTNAVQRQTHRLHTHTCTCTQTRWCTQTLTERSESTISIVFTYRSLQCYPQSFILPPTDKQREKSWSRSSTVLQVNASSLHVT